MVCHHVSIKLVENEGISCEKAISSKNNMCGKTISGYYLYIYEKIEQQQPIGSGKNDCHHGSMDFHVESFWPRCLAPLQPLSLTILNRCDYHCFMCGTLIHLLIAILSQMPLSTNMDSETAALMSFCAFLEAWNDLIMSHRGWMWEC